MDENRMSRHTRSYIAITLLVATVASGCKPIQPFYLGGHDDLAHYIDVATDLEYPDVQEASLAESVMAEAPFSLTNPEPRELWDLTLEEVVQISLHNSKVLKQIGGGISNLGFGNAAVNSSVFLAPPSSALRNLATTPDAVATIYNPALQETNVASTATQGVESALADFDAQFSTSLFWDRADRRENLATGALRKEDQVVLQTQLARRAATGMQLAFRNNTIYSEPTAGTGRPRLHDWLTNFEAEIRQPIARGRGTQVNRVPVVLARIRTDVSLADFESNVRNHVFDVEKSYWELYFAYRNLESLKARRDSVHYIWRVVKNKFVAQTEGGTAQSEALARQEYFQARASVEAALLDLFKAESRLRFMMGLAPTDGRLVRPVDEPLNARLTFDWQQVLSEALCRSCELRIKRWHIKQREMEMIQARNQLLPQMDAVALYRWLGRGEDLVSQGNSPAFPAAGSGAVEEMLHGKYQEFRLGFEFALPVGFRREMAGVRNSQLQLARERAILQETELEVVHHLSDVVQNVDGWYQLAETNFNRRVATEKEVEAYSALVTGETGSGSTNLEFLLNAITRNADAQSLFYRSLVNYTVSVSEVHFQKGSLLEYNNVLLAEGTWPGKAYFDARGLARQRSAGHYMNYGFTRPRVISNGSYEQFQSTDQHGQGGSVHEQFEPIEAGQPVSPLPSPDDAAATSGEQSNVQPATATTPVQVVNVLPTASGAAQPQTPAATAKPASAGETTAAAGTVEIRVKKGSQFEWGDLGGLKKE